MEHDGHGKTIHKAVGTGSAMFPAINAGAELDASVPARRRSGGTRTSRAAGPPLLSAGYRRVVIDLRGLSFMDSTGLHSVLGMQRSAERDGVDFAIVPGDDAVRHVFELRQTVDLLPFVDPRALGLD